MAGGAAWEVTGASTRQDELGGLQRSQGGFSGQAKSKVVECLEIPSMQMVTFGGNNRSCLWGQSGSPVHPGGRTPGQLTLHRRMAACRRPPRLPPDPRPLPRRFPCCLLAQRIGSAVPLKGLSQRVKNETDSQWKGWSPDWPGARAAAAEEAVTAAACVRSVQRAATTKPYLRFHRGVRLV